jgi:spore cortex formation protein SpoVR/YcgB (stage V sporulation)
MVQENMETKYDMCSIFKPSDLHANILEDIGNIRKRITKQNHINIVEGPGNRLDRNYHYSIENDVSFITEWSTNNSMGSVYLFEGNDRI